MHACGHDGHMAILAAAARLLADNGIVPRRTVRFVFQPGEEVVGAGRQLAALGAYDGTLSAYALHGWPGLPLGSVGVKNGEFFGASHNFRAVFRGKGVHGAYPEKGENPLPAAARALLKLQELHEGVFGEFGEVVSPCALNGGSAANVIPGEAEILGTVRYLDPARGQYLEKSIREILSGSDLKYDTVYDTPVVNNPGRTDVVRRAAGTAGLEIIEEETVERGSEDFAFALRQVPGCLYKLGLGEQMPALHSPDFDFPDEALAPGILMMTRLAIGEEEK
jgi:amidohydrolase